MEIKITKSNNARSWYYSRIGEVFEVLETNKIKRHFVVHKGRVLNSFVNFEDCEIIHDIIEENKEAFQENDIIELRDTLNEISKEV